ncbi:MAG: abortive infection family protein [Rhodospirillaceae bacterium]|nr:abortive infection family protein [Rhodospirillaceae bacterium]
MAKIPPAIIGVVSSIFADHHTHAQLTSLFLSSGFPDAIPDGNKMDKCQRWMRAANNEFDDALERLARLIAEFMDAPVAPVLPPWSPNFVESAPDPRQKILEALAREGLSYHRGGQIFGSNLAGPSRSLAEHLERDGVKALETEYQRAYAQIEADPHAALTAACAILESVCKAYLESREIPLPNKQVLSSLWAETARHLGLSPKEVADDDLKRILTGLYSIAEGVASLRTHEGSAHGHSPRKTYKLASRHARLAVHAAHTMALFVLETWKAREVNESEPRPKN